MKKFTSLAAVLAGTAILAGCTLAPHVTDKTTADDLTWPKVDQRMERLDAKPDNIAQLRLGMHKDQLYSLVGVPQVTHGWVSPVWDYTLNFETKDQGVVQCQLKVLFDQTNHVTHYFWKPVTPYEGACPVQK